MKHILLVVVMLLSMTSAFAERSVKQSLQTLEPVKIVEPIDCRLVRFSNPADYEACCKANPKSCGIKEVENHCPKGWLETVKCTYGVDEKNCSCLAPPAK